MPRKRAVKIEAPVVSMQAEMEALRAEMARLRRQEVELARRIAEEAKGEERRFHRMLGHVLLRDLDPGPIAHAMDDSARRALAMRSAHFAARIRAGINVMNACPSLVADLLDRLDAQSGRTPEPLRIEHDMVDHQTEAVD